MEALLGPGLGVKRGPSLSSPIALSLLGNTFQTYTAVCGAVVANEVAGRRRSTAVSMSRSHMVPWPHIS